MKEKFLALVQEVKETAIAEAIYNTSNVEEFKTVFQKFLNENQELVAKIQSWKEEYKAIKWEEREPIFAQGEEIQNPMEIVIIIRIINDIKQVSEYELFEWPDDLIQAIVDTGNDFTVALGCLMFELLIDRITAEQIFKII